MAENTPTQAESQETAELNQATGGSFYRPGGDTLRARGWFKKHRVKIFGGGTILALLVGGGLFLLRPLEIVHWAKNLEAFHFSANEEVTESRLTRAVRRLRYDRTVAERRRMNTVANKWVDKYETRFEQKLGIRMEYEGGTLRRLRVVDRGKASSVLRELELEGFNTKNNVIDIPNSFFDSPTRISNKVLTRSLNLNKVSTAVAKRMLNIRTGTPLFHPFFKKKSGEPFSDYVSRIRERWRERTRGDKINVETNFEDTDSKPEEQSKGNQNADSGSKAVNDVKVDGDIQGTKSNIQAGGSALLGLGILCAIHAIDSKADQFDYLNKQLPMIKMAMGVVGGGNQVMSGDDFDAEGLGEIVNRFYDPETGTSIDNARSIQYELGNEAKGPDIADSAKLGKKGTANTIIDTIADFPGLGAVCAAVSSVVGRVLFAIIDPIGELFEELVLDSIIENSIDNVARTLSGEPVNVDAKGAELGNYINHGARLAANDAAIALGGRELGAAEETELAQYLESKKLQERKSIGWLARLFDTESPDSFISQLAAAIPHRLNGNLSFGLDQVASFATGSIGWPSVNAQNDSSYDYGFPQVGFSVSELNDTRWEDPFDNAEWVERRWKSNDNPAGKVDFNKEYGQPCFGVTVSINGRLSFDPSNRYDKNEGSYFAKNKDKCNSKNNEELLRFRVFLADMITQTTMACYEGDDDSCTTLGMQIAADTSSTGVQGLECPSNMKERGGPNNAYWKIPENPDIYQIYSADSRRFGSEELVCALYTVAKAYKEKYGNQSTMFIGDLNAGAPHVSHYKGIAVDLDAQGAIWAGDHVNDGGNYNRQATIDLGKMWVDTGILQDIWWCPPSGDNSINVILNYARSNNKPLSQIKCLSGHENHFHVNIMEKFSGPTHAP